MLFDVKPLILKLKSHRQQHDVRQADLAKRIGVSGPTLSRWEHEKGSFNPTLNQLINMADIFGVSLSEMFSQDGGASSAPDEAKQDKPARKARRTKAAAKPKVEATPDAVEKTQPKTKVRASTTMKKTTGASKAAASGNARTAAKKLGRAGKK